MPMLLLGVALLVLKFLEIDPVAGWSWWWIFVPFGLAAAWWAYADASGLTRRRAERKVEERAAERRRRSMSALGLDSHGRRGGGDKGR